MSIAYIGLGSNLDNPLKQLREARRAMSDMPSSRLLADSGLFKSRAMILQGDDPQPDYINAVIKLETDLQPHVLLKQLQAIESSQGRVRTKRWGARTLDLDILLYDDLHIHDEQLSIPHPGIAERDFVLYPLKAIDDNLQIPGKGALSELIQQLPASSIEYLGAFDE